MKKSNFPKFTIITPSYNQEDFIEQTIQSVLDQNYPNLNYWVIDGNSTDQTRKILHEYKSELHFVSEDDKGQTDALNKGIARTLKGSNEPGFFAYINSDDYYLPEAFDKVLTAFKAHPEKMWLVGDCQIVDAESEIIQPQIQLYKKFWRRLLSFFVLSILNPIPQPAVFIRVEAVKKIGLFDANLNYVMDYDYWLRLYKKFGKPIIINQELAAFRIHSTSKGTTAYFKQFAEGYKTASKYSSNWLALLLHRLHNQVIFLIYGQIK